MASDDVAPQHEPNQAPVAGTPPVDAVRARRAQVAKWNSIATRVGYLLFAVAIVVFFIAFATDFNSVMGGIITACLIAGSVLLAPAIVIGYAVKAAEKDDVARGL